MNIYFVGAISGLKDHRPHFERIVKYLEDSNHNVQSDHILDRDHDRPETFKIKSDKLYFKITMDRIRTSDLMVADISKPTVNIGYEMSYALENNVPVLAVYYQGPDFKMTPLIIGNDSDLLIIKEYKESNLEEMLSSGLTEIDSMVNTRFIFTANPKIMDYLNWIAMYEKVPRSKFLRDIIQDKMNKDKDYQDFIKLKNDNS